MLKQDKLNGIYVLNNVAPEYANIDDDSISEFQSNYIRNKFRNFPTPTKLTCKPKVSFSVLLVKPLKTYKTCSCEKLLLIL